MGTHTIALDVGNARIGVAIANSIARVARPQTTIQNSDDAFETLRSLIKEYNVQEVVVGLPRNMRGERTAQTDNAEAFAEQIRHRLGVHVTMQDETLTSVQAEQELKKRGKPYVKGDIDALAATYILEDYLKEAP